MADPNPKPNQNPNLNLNLSLRNERDDKVKKDKDKDKAKLKELKKLPITRNLVLTGKFKWDSLNEEQIETEIKRAFNDQQLKVEFYKYSIEYNGKIYTRHLECISLLFCNAQQAQQNLARFVCGDIDLRSR